jgi:hypothetical protein
VHTTTACRAVSRTVLPSLPSTVDRPHAGEAPGAAHERHAIAVEPADLPLVAASRR